MQTPPVPDGVPPAADDSPGGAGTPDRLQALQSRLQAAEEALRRTRADLQVFSRAVSHDMKGPIGSIGVVIRNLLLSESERLGPSAKRMLQLVTAECDRMVQLVDEVATLAMVEQRALQPGPVAMQALAQEALDELRSGAAADKAAVASRAEVLLPTNPALPVVQGDAALLRLVWQQLLANALKFSAKAQSPRVQVQCRRSGDEWLFVVADNGVGFDMAYAGKLFGMFQRLHKASDYPGTGVGLVIVQRALQRLGGRVWAESSPDWGASFHFALPAGPEVPEVPEVPEAQEPPA